MPQCGNSYISEPVHASDALNVPHPEPTCALSKSWWIIYNIVIRTQNVFINHHKIKESVQMIIDYMKRHYRKGNFTTITNKFLRNTLEHYPVIYDNRTVDWLFVLNALNFALWKPRNVRQWTVNGLTGYMALCYAVKRAINEGYPLWSPEYYSNINYHDLMIIFRSDNNETTIPAIEDRRDILHEIGNVLLNKYQGSFKNCIHSCYSDSHKLLHLLLTEFRPFRDMAREQIYGRNKVYFGCKAMTLITDLWSYHIIFMDTRFMMSTMFVDYRVPQVLLHLGILYYNPQLIIRFTENADEPLLHGTNDEVELRCCSLVACRMLVQDVLMTCETYIQEMPELKTMIYSIPIVVDNFLWDYRHANDKLLYDTVPYHYVRSLYY